MSERYIAGKAPQKDEREALYVCKDSGKVSTNESFSRTLGLGSTKYLLKKKLENTIQQKIYEKYMLKNSQYLFTKPALDDCNPPLGPGGAPTVQISSPVNGETIYPGSTISISAFASASMGIKRIEFLVDGGLIGTDDASPYAISYQVPTLMTPGAHSVTAIVYDNEDKTSSSVITVNVSGGVVSVTVSSPVDNSNLNALPIALSATTLGVGITSVEFFLNGPGVYSQVYTDTDNSDGGWNASFNDDIAPNGTYNLFARAYKGSSVFKSNTVTFKLTR